MVGVVGWELLEDKIGYYSENMFNIPYFIINAITKLVGDSKIRNLTYWFIEPDQGLERLIM